MQKLIPFIKLFLLCSVLPRPRILLSLVLAVGRQGGTLPVPARSPAVPAAPEGRYGAIFWIPLLSAGLVPGGAERVPGMLIHPQPRAGSPELPPAIDNLPEAAHHRSGG